MRRKVSQAFLNASHRKKFENHWSKRTNFSKNYSIQSRLKNHILPKIYFLINFFSLAFAQVQFFLCCGSLVCKVVLNASTLPILRKENYARVAASVTVRTFKLTKASMQNGRIPLPGSSFNNLLGSVAVRS